MSETRPLLLAAIALREAADLFDQAHDYFERNKWKDGRDTVLLAMEKMREINGVIAATFNIGLKVDNSVG